jgi:hypothetical protein
MSGRSPRLARLLAMAFTGETDVAAIQSLVRRLLNQNEFASRVELLAQVDGIEYADGPVSMMRLHVPRTLDHPSVRACFSRAAWMIPSAFGPTPCSWASC